MTTWPSRQTRAFKNRRKRRRIFLFMTTLIIVVIAIFYTLFLSGWFKVKDIQVIDNRFSNAEQLKQNIADYLSSKKFLGLINFKNNLLFLAAGDFRTLLSQVPAIKDFKLSKNFKNRTLIFNIQERQINGVLCFGGEGGACFYFDSGGVVFAGAPQTEGSLIFLIRDNSGRIYNLGDGILSAENFGDLIAIRNLLANYFRLDLIQINAADLTIKSSAGWEIYLNPEDLARTFMALQNLIQNNFDFNSLEYLDLRYLPNIYWKSIS